MLAGWMPAMLLPALGDCVRSKAFSLVWTWQRAAGRAQAVQQSLSSLLLALERQNCWDNP